MEYNTTITTTASSSNFWVSGAGTDNWFIVDDSTNFDMRPTELKMLWKSDFQKLSDEFFMDHETEYHHNERLNRYYETKFTNKAITALMS